MSSELTGFVSGAFYMRNPYDIELDYQRSASGILEEVNFSPGDVLYQLMKIFKMREYQMELYANAIISGLSVQTAYGDFLDKHGESKGIFRKEKQPAGGYVHLTFDPPGAGESYDLYGTQYLTKKNDVFERSDSGNQVINRYIPITRGQSSRDGLPLPYIWITGIGYINNQSDGSGLTDYTPTWNQTYQFFNWSGVAGGTTGMTYYIEVTGSMRVKDGVVSESVGTGTNVGANTIISWTNNATLPADTTVNNPYSLTGGAEWESDDDFRERIIRATNRNFTLANIRSIAEGIQGVRGAHVYQALGTDIYSVNGSWSTEVTGVTASGIKITGNYSGASGLDYNSGALWSQKFTPSHGIIGMKRLVLRGKRTGYPPPLVVALREESAAEYVASGIFDTYDLKPPASSYQDMNVNINYLDLDHTEAYRLEFWCSEKTGASGAGYWDDNYWTLATGNRISGNMGDNLSGYLVDPAGAYDVSGNLLFKTQYGAAAFKIDLAVDDGYVYDDLETELDNKLDWVDGSGYAPIGVNYTISQATEVPIYYVATVYVKDTSLSTLAAIKDRIDVEVGKYIKGLEPGENVIYSEIYKNIMNDGDIWRITDMYIYESGGSQLEDEDIHIADNEVPVFKGSTVNRG